MARVQPYFVLGALAWFLITTLSPADDSAAAIDISYWADSAGSATIDDVAATDEDAFQRLASTRVHLGYSNVDHWFRITLPDLAASERFVLSLSNPRLGEATLFTPTQDGGYSATMAGVRVPFWSREIPSLAPAFPLVDTGPQALYLRVKNSGSMRFKLAVEPRNVFQKRSRTLLAFSLSIGAGLFVVALYNFLTYLHLRQTGYLWIAAFMTACTLRQMTASATANMFLWPDAPLWAKHAMTFTGLATLLLGVGMAHSLLRTAQWSRRWTQVNWALGAMALAGGIFSTAGFKLSLFLMLTCSILIPLSVAACALRAVQRGLRLAIWFLLSWGAVLAASIISNLVGPGYLPENLFTDHVLDIALLGAGLTWSFSLTSQIKVRQEAQRQLLETKVRERTRALEEALEAVRTLRGLVPICSCCKKIRNDDGFWEQVEIYLSEHTEADFSHGLCPDCAETNYPAYFPRKQNPPETLEEHGSESPGQ